MAKLEWNIRQNENGLTCIQIIDETGCFSVFIPFTLYESIYTQALEFLSKETSLGGDHDVVKTT